MRFSIGVRRGSFPCIKDADKNKYCMFPPDFEEFLQDVVDKLNKAASVIQMYEDFIWGDLGNESENESE